VRIGGRRERVDGALACVALAALSFVACNRPNPAFRATVEVPGGPTDGGLGERMMLDGSSADLGDTPLPDGTGELIVSGDAADGPPVDPRDVAAPPPDLAPDLPAPPLDAAAELNPPEPVELNRGLRLHWDFNDGTATIIDRSPAGNDGVFEQGARAVVNGANGIPGAATTTYHARTDGDDEYLEADIDAPLPSIRAAKTIAVWLAPDSTTTPGLRSVVNLFNDADTAGLQLGTRDGKPACWHWKDGVDFTLIAASPPRAGWYHLAYTHQDGVQRLFVDGTLIGTSLRTLQTGNSDNLLVGSFSAEFFPETFDGRIDELRIYDRVLNSAELQRLAAGE
jgi:hypothetical protein